MSQAVTPRSLSASEPPPAAPGEALTPEQQLEAMCRAQDEAERRIKLGMELFKAAEAHTDGHRQIVERLKQETARGLASADLSDPGDGFNTALKSIEDRIDKLQSDWSNTRSRIEAMMKQSESLLGQSRKLLDA